MPHFFVRRYRMPDRPDDPGDQRSSADGFSPTTDLCETTDGYEVRMELAGVDPANVEVEISQDGHSLTVSGSRPPCAGAGTRRYLNLEIQYGSFYRDIHFAEPVDGAQSRASWQHGMLLVELPKFTGSARRRNVPIIEQ